MPAPAAGPNTKIRVVGRIRPLSKIEKEKGAKETLISLAGTNKKDPEVYTEEPEMIQVTEESGTIRYFELDAVFDKNCTQREVYVRSGCLKAVTEDLFYGYNCTVLAYGQTGAGKSFSMGTASHSTEIGEFDGMIPRACHDLFQIIQEKCEGNAKVFLQYIEIYNEELRDLLVDNEHIKPLKIRETLDGGIVIAGLESKLVASPQEIGVLMEEASTRRVVAATAMNAVSSRSHAMCVLKVEGVVETDDGSDKFTSKLTLVDLAGSERASKTGATGGRLKEGININKSLMVLGQVVSALATKDQKLARKPPYRDSKLTRLLQDSLGGNSQTIMVTCASPADYNIEESINTLRYATSARNIKISATKNVVKNISPEEAAEFQRENQLLKKQVQELQATIKTMAKEPANSTASTSNSTVSSIRDDSAIESLKDAAASTVPTESMTAAGLAVPTTPTTGTSTESTSPDASTASTASTVSTANSTVSCAGSSLISHAEEKETENAIMLNNQNQEVIDKNDQPFEEIEKESQKLQKQWKKEYIINGEDQVVTEEEDKHIEDLGAQKETAPIAPIAPTTSTTSMQPIASTKTSTPTSTVSIISTEASSISYADSSLISDTEEKVEGKSENIENRLNDIQRLQKKLQNSEKLIILNNKHIEGKNQCVEELEKENQQLIGEKSNLLSEVEKLREVASEKRELEEENHKLREKLDCANQHINEKDQHIEEIKSENQRIEKLLKDNQRLQKKVEKTEKVLILHNQQIDEKDQRIKEVENENRQLIEKESDLHLEVEKLRVEASQKEEVEEENRKLREGIDTARLDADRAHEHILERDRRIEEIESENLRIEKLLKDNQRLQKKLQKTEKVIMMNNEHIDEKDRRIKEIENENQQLIMKESNLHLEVEKLLEKASKKEELEEENRRIREELDEADCAHQKIDEKDQYIKEIENENQELIRKKASLLLEVGKFHEESSRKEELEEEIQALREELDTALNDLDRKYQLIDEKDKKIEDIEHDKQKLIGEASSLRFVVEKLRREASQIEELEEENRKLAQIEAECAQRTAALTREELDHSSPRNNNEMEIEIKKKEKQWITFVLQILDSKLGDFKKLTNDFDVVMMLVNNMIKSAFCFGFGRKESPEATIRIKMLNDQIKFFPDFITKIENSLGEEANSLREIKYDLERVISTI